MPQTSIICIHKAQNNDRAEIKFYIEIPVEWLYHDQTDIFVILTPRIIFLMLNFLHSILLQRKILIHTNFLSKWLKISPISLTNQLIFFSHTCELKTFIAPFSKTRCIQKEYSAVLKIESHHVPNLHQYLAKHRGNKNKNEKRIWQ